MAKLGNFESPTGAKGNVFDIGDWGSMILGTVMLLVTFGIGEHFANKLTGKVPAASISNPFPPQVPVSTAPQKITL